MQDFVNKLKILMRNIYTFDLNFAEKHAITESRFVKSKLENMRRKVELL